MLHVQKVGALQVAIPLRIERIDGGGVDHGFNSGRGGVVQVIDQLAFHIAETTAHVGDHHVADGELRARVRGVKFVACFHGSPSFGWSP